MLFLLFCLLPPLVMFTIPHWLQCTVYTAIQIINARHCTVSWRLACDVYDSLPHANNIHLNFSTFQLRFGFSDENTFRRFTPESLSNETCFDESRRPPSFRGSCPFTSYFYKSMWVSKNVRWHLRRSWGTLHFGAAPFVPSGGYTFCSHRLGQFYEYIYYWHILQKFSTPSQIQNWIENRFING